MGSKPKKSAYPTPPDQDQRDLIHDKLDCNMLVEAAAGTGKTTSMIGRMIALLKTGECKNIRTLVAVTFTRKAAAELRTRFQIQLERAIQEAKDVQKKNLEQALDNIEQCFIGTIHSFCARLLHERPIEAGVDIAFDEIDDDDDLLLRDEAWNRFISTLLIDDPDNLLPDLDRYDLQLGILADTFKRFVEYPDIDEWPGYNDQIELSKFDSIVKEIKVYIAHMEQLSPKLPKDSGNDKLIPKYKSLPRLVSHYDDLNQPQQLMAILEKFNSKPKLIQKEWTKDGNFTKNDANVEEKRWKDFKQNVVEPALCEWRQCRYSPIMKIMFSARKIYDDLRAERGVLNFQDLLMKSAELLRNNPFIRRYFQHRFTHLLIDEFQDTDPIQAQVMMYLTAIDENETSWRKCIPAPGSLFVVGDPKQSIYRFRRADIVTYNDVKDIICSNGGKIVRLSTNFRTVGNVINWVNNVFESDDSDTEISTEPMLRFPKKDYDESPSYVALQEGRVDGNIGELSGVFRLLIPDEYSRREMAVEYEADHIARTIRNAIDTGITIPRTKKEILSGVKKQVNSDDFMIITRNRKDLSVYARELQEYGIPHKVTGGSSLNEVDELRLLYICLLTVIHPDNPVYLVAALRSELFGISDTSLYKFKKAGGRFSFYTSIPAKFSMDESQIFTDIFNRLKGYALWLSAMPPISAFEKIINDLGLMISAAIKPGGDIEAGGLAKCIEILRSVQRESWTSSQLVERIGKLVENEDKYDGISIRSEEIPAVQIMNLHKVKGLEAPVVFLANPFGESKHPADLHIDRSEDKTKGYLAVYHKISEFQSILIAHPQNWENLSEREKRFEEAENLRLRYVAATRAGSAMIITQKNKRNNTNPWKYFNDLLSADMEISNPGQQSAPKLEETLILPEEVDFAEKDIDGRYSQISSPTYKVQAAKDYALSKAKKTGDLDIPVETDHKYESENIPIPDDEHGLEWGTLIHSLLQYAMDNPDAELKNITENLLRENDLDIGLASKAITLVRSLIQSDIWQRALKSERRFTEFPFQIYSNEGDDDSKPTLIRGAIDLVFQEKDGWVIVDYKTDIINKDNLKATTNKYAPQLQLYADVWRESVKKPIKEIGIYFSYSSQYIKII